MPGKSQTKDFWEWSQGRSIPKAGVTCFVAGLPAQLHKQRRGRNRAGPELLMVGDLSVPDCPVCTLCGVTFQFLHEEDLDFCWPCSLLWPATDGQSDSGRLQAQSPGDPEPFGAPLRSHLDHENRPGGLLEGERPRGAETSRNMSGASQDQQNHRDESSRNSWPAEPHSK